jgi:hypothetical protein
MSLVFEDDAFSISESPPKKVVEDDELGEGPVEGPEITDDSPDHEPEDESQPMIMSLISLSLSSEDDEYRLVMSKDRESSPAVPVDMAIVSMELETGSPSVMVEEAEEEFPVSSGGYGPCSSQSVIMKDTTVITSPNLLVDMIEVEPESQVVQIRNEYPEF